MITRIKSFALFLALAPLAHLLWLAAMDELGANPVEFVIRSLGRWTLIVLLATLAMTPLRLLINASWPIQLRRMLGLFAFTYLCLHFLAYAGLDQWFDLDAIAGDIVKHPYVLVGFGAFLLMIPLAITSSNRMMKKMGRRWKTLHRTVYLIAVLGVVHYWWLVKKDVTEPALYAAILFLLFGIRLLYRWQGKAGLANPSGAPIRNTTTTNTI